MVEKQIPWLYLAQLSDVSAIEKKMDVQTVVHVKIVEMNMDNDPSHLEGGRGNHMMSKNIQLGESLVAIFLLDMGEESVIGRFITSGFDVSPENVHCIYMHIYNLSLKCTSIEFPFYPRSNYYKKVSVISSSAIWTYCTTFQLK